MLETKEARWLGTEQFSVAFSGGQLKWPLRTLFLDTALTSQASGWTPSAFLAIPPGTEPLSPLLPVVPGSPNLAPAPGLAALPHANLAWDPVPSDNLRGPLTTSMRPPGRIPTTHTERQQLPKALGAPCSALQLLIMKWAQSSLTLLGRLHGFLVEGPSQTCCTNIPESGA